MNAAIVSRLALAALCVAACRPSGAREARDFERMRRQQRYDVYDTSRTFANGAVNQAPPAHTVARDPALAARGEVASVAFLQGTSAGTPVAALPITVDDSTLARGARQFAISCAPCHGSGGFGGGPLAPNLGDRRPPSLRTPRVAAMSAGVLFRIITDGLGRMPPYGWQLPPSARWEVVAHVRALDSLPSTAAFRADSAAAAGLRQLDSLRAAHADLATILQFLRRPR